MANKEQNELWGYDPKGTYMDAEMSTADKAKVDDLGRQYAEYQAVGDQAGMDRVHQEAEDIRAGYGYSGGADGSEYLSKPKTDAGSAGGSGAPVEFSYRSAPTYTNKYQGMIDELTQQILGRAAFEYDPESDPAYQQYKESYTLNGKRAMEDTLGQMAARTGGLASSYAGVAAQQTYDRYMSALADKVPELRQLAYQMYQDEGTAQRANLAMLQALEQGDYNKYATLLGQYNADRNFEYGMFSDQRNFDFLQDQEDYRRKQDALEHSDREREWQYQQDSDKAAMLYTAGDPSGYAELWGLTPEETQRMVDQYAEKKQLTQDAAARELADYYAKYGDLSKVRELGVDTSRMEGEYGASYQAPVKEPTPLGGDDPMSPKGDSLPIPTQEPMTSSEFDNFLNSYGRQHYDDDPLVVADEIWGMVESGRLTTEQYERAVKALGFEE